MSAVLSFTRAFFITKEKKKNPLSIGNYFYNYEMMFNREYMIFNLCEIMIIGFFQKY